MTEAEAASLIVGILMPLVVAVVQQPRWSSGLRATITAVSSLFAGLITTAATHGLHSDGHVIVVTAQVLVTAQATYLAFWKPTKIAPAIEQATSPGPAP